MECRDRKDIRLINFDYSRNGAYFVTVCTAGKKCLFWENYDVFPMADIYDNTPQAGVGAVIGRPPDDQDRPQATKKIRLTEYGKYVKEHLHEINLHYPMVYVDKYVIMPNHIHTIIRIDRPPDNEIGGRPMTAPTLSWIINQFKGAVTKKSGFPVWQRNYYEHIIRNKNEYRDIWDYIQNNPISWEKDEYYTKE